MPVAGLSFLSPAWLLVCMSAAIPVVTAGWLVWRHETTARVLGLRAASPGAYVPAAAAAATACLVLGLAAAQPVLTTTTDRTGRTESELLFVVDVSRSMSASTAAGRPTQAGPGSRDRRGAPGSGARRPGGHLGTHRPAAPVRLRDARPRRLRRDPCRQRAGRRAASAGRLARRHELRAADDGRTQRLLQARPRHPHVRARDGRRDAGDRGRRIIPVRRLQPGRRAGRRARRPDLHARWRGRRRLPPGTLGCRGRGPARRQHGWKRVRGKRPGGRARRRPRGCRARAEPDDRHLPDDARASRRTSPGSH